MHRDQVGFIPEMLGWVDICKVVHVMPHINEAQCKDHTIITRDAEKTFNKIEHTLMIKTLNKAGVEGRYLHIIEAMAWPGHSRGLLLFSVHPLPDQSLSDPHPLTCPTLPLNHRAQSVAACVLAPPFLPASY